MVRATMVCKYRKMSDNAIYIPRVPRTEREFLLRGANYHVSEWGPPTAPLLVYLHGWADTGSTFQFVVDALRDDWRVVAPDWRGFGRSSCDCTSYWFPDYLADLHALLSIYSPALPLRLAGHSMGGNIASLYAGSFPERVQAFVNIEGFGLADSAPGDAPGRYRAWIEGSATPPSFADYPDFDALATRIQKRHPAMTRAAAAFVAREWASEDRDGRVRLRADPRHKLPNPVLYRRAEAVACARAMTAAMRLISGGNSEFARAAGAATASLYPHSDSVTIEGAGHMLHFEAPAVLAGAIEAFMRQAL
ncbi:MAG: alpha/beta hydrolase [Woeseiaceae bacterium]|nr:alpha/beta hydrolase [Woeseiaceae bacterium]